MTPRRPGYAVHAHTVLSLLLFLLLCRILKPPYSVVWERVVRLVPLSLNRSLFLSLSCYCTCRIFFVYTANHCIHIHLHLTCCITEASVFKRIYTPYPSPGIAWTHCISTYSLLVIQAGRTWQTMSFVVTWRCRCPIRDVAVCLSTQRNDNMKQVNKEALSCHISCIVFHIIPRYIWTSYSNMICIVFYITPPYIYISYSNMIPHRGLSYIIKVIDHDIPHVLSYIPRWDHRVWRQQAP